MSEFSLGVEEEYFLTDLETLDLVSDPPPALMTALKSELGECVTNELFRCQIEAVTPVCRTIAEVRASLAALREAVTRIAAQFGYAPLAASTHPLGDWRVQPKLPDPRYKRLVDELAHTVYPYLISGLHVHLGIEDDDQRHRLLVAFAPYLPYLLALTTSSPYWEGRDTGLHSYRMNLAHALPRTGLPHDLETPASYRELVRILMEAGAIGDKNSLWWDVRPSGKFPTLEMRVFDACPDLNDVIAVTALYQALGAYLIRTGKTGDGNRLAPHLIRENLWRAQRYGLEKGFVGEDGTLKPAADAIAALIETVTPDAARLGCLEELRHLNVIAARGTSADRQRRIYHTARSGGFTHEASLRQVTKALIADMTAY